MGETNSALYPGELFHEMFPELDPAVRHLGARALTFAISGAPAAAARLVPDQLPDFEAYLSAKYPGLPPAAAADLVRHFHDLTEHHATDRRPPV
jgi:hypothetical protein